MNVQDKANGDQQKITRKNSTAEAPMVGLNDVVEFIRTIHEQGLERAPMPKVAEGTGYSNASSTPFYRRAAAARLFGLISGRGGADLSDLGQDCVKPTSEDATHCALLKAIQNIPAYVELLEQYNGRRVNTGILANWFERRLALNETGAGACAKAFVDSLRYAGALSADNLLSFSGSERAGASPKSPPSTVSRSIEEDEMGSEDGHRFELILDPKSKRKFVIFSPASVTQAELKRIQDWLGFQLLVTSLDQS